MSPRKTVFKRDDVLDAAFLIVQEHGIRALTARNVANKLKSSVAPIYSCYRTMAELRKATIFKAAELLVEYSLVQRTERKFLNIGVGLALFARDHRQLFRAIFLEGDEFKEVIDETFTAFKHQMRADSRFTTLSETDLNELFNKMSVFTLGLATLINTHISEDESEEFIINTLLNVGSDIIGSTLRKLEQ
jgi:AcrR family transcriptional regulator